MYWVMTDLPVGAGPLGRHPCCCEDPCFAGLAVPVAIANDEPLPSPLLFISANFAKTVKAPKAKANSLNTKLIRRNQFVVFVKGLISPSPRLSGAVFIKTFASNRSAKLVVSKSDLKLDAVFLDNPAATTSAMHVADVVTANTICKIENFHRSVSLV